MYFAKVKLRQSDIVKVALTDFLKPRKTEVVMVMYYAIRDQ